MWIEAENGMLYNAVHILRIYLEHSGDMWRLKADLAFAGPMSGDAHTAHYPSVTLKSFTDESEALGVMKNLKGRFDKLVVLVAPRATG